jgi:hypothetical protein
LPRPEPRDPDGEDLVVPERARREEPRPGGDGQGGDSQRDCGSEAAEVVSLAFDALS